MSGSTITARQLTAALATAVGNDAVLRVKGGAVTTAPRSFCERVVHFFRGDKPDDLRALETAMRAALREKRFVTEDIAVKVLERARGREGKSITIGQFRAAEIDAQWMARRARTQALALQVGGQRNAEGLAPQAPGSGEIDADLPSMAQAQAQAQARKELYQQMMGLKLLTLPDDDARPANDAAPAWATETFEHVQTLSPEQVEKAQGLIEAGKHQALHLIYALSRGAYPATLMSSVMELEAWASQLGTEEAGRQEQGLALVLEQSMAAIPVREAEQLYKAVMSEGGAGRVLLAGLDIVADKHGRGDGELPPPPAQRLADVLEQTLARLAERGGHDAARETLPAIRSDRTQAASGMAGGIQEYLTPQVRKAFAHWQTGLEALKKQRPEEQAVWLRRGRDLARQLPPSYKPAAERQIMIIEGALLYNRLEQVPARLAALKAQIAWLKESVAKLPRNAEAISSVDKRLDALKGRFKDELKLPSEEQSASDARQINEEASLDTEAKKRAAEAKKEAKKQAEEAWDHSLRLVETDRDTIPVVKRLLSDLWRLQDEVDAQYDSVDKQLQLVRTFDNAIWEIEKIGPTRRSNEKLATLASQLDSLPVAGSSRAGRLVELFDLGVNYYDESLNGSIPIVSAILLANPEIQEKMYNKAHSLCKEIYSFDTEGLYNDTPAARQWWPFIQALVSAIPKLDSSIVKKIAQKFGKYLGLAHCDFSGINLEGIDLSGCYLNGVNFEKANLSKAHLGRVTCADVNFSSADLSHANIEFVRGRGANFKSAKLASVNMLECDFTQSNFGGADLSGGTLKSVSLVATDLTNVQLGNSNLLRGDNRLDDAKLGATEMGHLWKELSDFISFNNPDVEPGVSDDNNDAYHNEYGVFVDIWNSINTIPAEHNTTKIKMAEAVFMKLEETGKLKNVLTEVMCVILSDSIYLREIPSIRKRFNESFVPRELNRLSEVHVDSIRSEAWLTTMTNVMAEKLTQEGRDWAKRNGMAVFQLLALLRRSASGSLVEQAARLRQSYLDLLPQSLREGVATQNRAVAADEYLPVFSEDGQCALLLNNEYFDKCVRVKASTEEGMEQNRPWNRLVVLRCAPDASDGTWVTDTSLATAELGAEVWDKTLSGVPVLYTAYYRDMCSSGVPGYEDPFVGYVDPFFLESVYELNCNSPSPDQDQG